MGLRNRPRRGRRWRRLRAAAGCALLSLTAAAPSGAAPDAARPPERPPERIVSLLPSLTEILFAVGAGERVVGVTDHCNFPPEARTRREIGGYLPSLMSLETIVALRPDLVLAQGDLQLPAVADLRRLGLRVEIVPARSVEEIAAAIRRVGALVGRPEQGERVAREVENEIEAVRRRARAIPHEERPRAFYEVWEQPLMTAGGASFISELIEIAGGVNVFSEVDQEYFPVSLEEVIRRDPQLILRARHGDGDEVTRYAERPDWRAMEAVRKDRICIVDGDLVSRPGPRIGSALALLARCLHPRETPPPGGAP